MLDTDEPKTKETSEFLQQALDCVFLKKNVTATRHVRVKSSIFPTN
jgi:hypothetical protein